MIYSCVALLGMMVLLSCFVVKPPEQDTYGARAVLVDVTGSLPVPEDGLVLGERTTLGGRGADVDLRALDVRRLEAVVELRETGFTIFPSEEISEAGVFVQRGEQLLVPFASAPVRLHSGDAVVVRGTRALEFYYC